MGEGLGDIYYASYVEFGDGQLVRVDGKKDKVWKVTGNNYWKWSSDKSAFRLPSREDANGGIKYTLVNNDNESEVLKDVAQNRLTAKNTSFGIMRRLGLKKGGKRKTRKLKKSKRKHTRKSKKTNKKRRSTRRR